MEDTKIVDLIYSRNEDGICEAISKYSKLLTSVAGGILKTDEDCEECVNDTYMKVWNSIPPNRPQHFKAFICKIARTLALDKYRYNHRQSRNYENSFSFDDLDFEIGSKNLTESEYFSKALSQDINAFLKNLTDDKRNMFIKRCFMFESYEKLAEEFGISENNARVRVLRVRNELKNYLKERGYDVE